MTLDVVGQTKENEFLIGVEDVNYAPFYDFSSDNPHSNRPSFTRDLLSQFFESHEIEYRFIALPVKRFDKWYIENSIDFKFPDNRRWRMGEDAKLPIVFSQPVLKLTAGTYVLKRHEHIKRNEVNKLVTILGFFPTLWIDKIADNELELLEESSPMSIVKHMLHGNAIATNIDENVIKHNLNILKLDDDFVLAKNIKHECYSYHLSTIKHPKILALFDQFLVENKSFIAELKQKYNIKE